MNRLIPALALAPVLFCTPVLAQTVPEDATKQLWCGTALSIAFGEPPEGLTEEQLAEGKGYYDGGLLLIEMGGKGHLDAGLTQEALDKLKADLVAEVTPVVSGEVEEAKYTFEECVAIIPAPADASSSAM